MSKPVTGQREEELMVHVSWGFMFSFMHYVLWALLVQGVFAKGSPVDDYLHQHKGSNLMAWVCTITVAGVISLVGGLISALSIFCVRFRSRKAYSNFLYFLSAVCALHLATIAVAAALTYTLRKYHLDMALTTHIVLNLSLDLIIFERLYRCGGG